MPQQDTATLPTHPAPPTFSTQLTLDPSPKTDLASLLQRGPSGTSRAQDYFLEDLTFVRGVIHHKTTQIEGRVMHDDTFTHSPRRARPPAVTVVTDLPNSKSIWIAARITDHHPSE